MGGLGCRGPTSRQGLFLHQQLSLRSGGGELPDFLDLSVERVESDYVIGWPGRRAVSGRTIRLSGLARRASGPTCVRQSLAKLGHHSQPASGWAVLRRGGLALPASGAGGRRPGALPGRAGSFLRHRYLPIHAVQPAAHLPPATGHFLDCDCLGCGRSLHGASGGRRRAQRPASRRPVAARRTDCRRVGSGWGIKARSTWTWAASGNCCWPQALWAGWC